MVVTFLGTGTSQGVPVIACKCEVCNSLDYRNKRLRVSVHIETEALSLVIDAGPDFRQQMLRENISQLDAILLTHEHKDHIAGLDDIRAFNFLQKNALPIYALERTHAQVRREFYYVFEDKKYPGIPQMNLQTIDNEAFSIDTLTIEPIQVKHHEMLVLGFKMGRFAYITDANYISDLEQEKLANLDVLVLNALQKGPHISHFTLAEAVALIQKLKPKQAYLTHISHKLGLHSQVEHELPPGIQLAYDGLKIKIEA